MKKDYETIAAELEKKANRIRNLAEILDYLTDQMEYRMPFVLDENGERVTDPVTEKYIRLEPDENYWQHDEYCAWCEIVGAVQAYIDKVAK